MATLSEGREIVSTLKASFDGSKFDQVQGFRISAAFTPGHGFGENFFIYLLDYVEAKSRFKDDMKVFKPGSNPEPRRGTLELASSDFTYTFEGLELHSAELGATRARRYRFLEFRFPKEQDGGTELVPKVRVTSKWTAEKSLKPARLADDYKYSLGAKAEHLLGFRSRLSPFDVNVLRFAGRRTQATSFLEKIVDAAKSQVEGRMQSFTINFSPKSIEATQDNLVRAFVDESYGFFTTLGLPELSRIAQSHSSPDLVRLEAPDFSPLGLIHHNYANFPDQENWMENNDVVETGTFVFEPSWYNELPVK
jgi:hypothetical protein